MIIARKLLTYFVLGMLLVLGVSSYLRVQREIELFDTDTVGDHRLLGRAMEAAILRIWRIDGPEEATALVARISREEPLVKAHWVPEAEFEHLGPAQQLSPEERKSLLEARGFLARSVKLPEAVYTFVSMPVSGGAHGVLELVESLAPRNRYVEATIINTTVTTAIIAVLCGLLGSAFGLSLVGRPIRELVLQARRVGAGDLGTRVKLFQKDEIGELGREMNAMCDRLAEARERVELETDARIQALGQLRHADRLATVGKLASGVAHEIGTPLNVISGRAKMIERQAPDPGAQDNARIIREQSDRVANIIRQLLDFARAGTSTKRKTHVEQTIQRTLSLLGPIAEKHRATLKVTSGPDLPELDADAAQVQQVVTNLVVNAVQAMENPGEVAVHIERRKARPAAGGGGEREYVAIEIRDQGKGIVQEDLNRIFEPFFTTKDVGEGTGLGLSVAYGIVQEHRGFIDVESTPGSGSRFTVYLPTGENS